MIGNYGDITFETSDERILNFTGFSRDSVGRWAPHDVIDRKPVLEYLGPELDTITFTVALNGNFGVRPRDEMERWLIKCRDGTAETLVIGGKPLGMDKWVVLSVSQMWGVVFNRGEVFAGSVDVELNEYLEG